jgi:hypothetical protein
MRCILILRTSDPVLTEAAEVIVSQKSQPHVNWQPISALALIGSMIDGMLDDLEKQAATLEACRSKPHVLDDYTVNRVIKVYSTMDEDVWLYEQQLARWKNLDLTVSQRQEVNRLSERIPAIKGRISGILALAEELKSGTIDTILAKSDLEIGLEWLLGKRKL